MQKILLSFRRLIAKITPHDSTAGRAGGTACVMTSRKRLTIILVSIPISSSNLTTAKHPIIARAAMMKVNLFPSDLKLNWISFG